MEAVSCKPLRVFVECDLLCSPDGKATLKAVKNGLISGISKNNLIKLIKENEIESVPELSCVDVEHTEEGEL